MSWFHDQVFTAPDQFNSLTIEGFLINSWTYIFRMINMDTKSFALIFL